jgi:choline dehydrogenase-like flavoprotein
VKKRVLVVGGGTAGSIVAATLAECTDFQVTLLEAGLDRAEELQSNLYECIAAPHACWPHIEATLDNSSFAYVRGLGIGGTSQINGGVYEVPPLHDFDAWHAIAGDNSWSASNVAPTFKALAERLVTINQAQWGRVDHALAHSTGKFAELTTTAAQLALHPASLHRRNVGVEKLADARSNQRALTIRSDATVERLVERTINEPSATINGVQLTTGEVIVADHIVLCAGAIGSPLILLRSTRSNPSLSNPSVSNPSIGANLRNHLGVATTLKFANAESAQTLVTNATARTNDDIQITALNTVSMNTSDAAYGALLISPLRATEGRGRVGINSNGDPTIEFRTTQRDRDQLREAAKLLLKITNDIVESGHAEAAFVDATGTSIGSLRNASDQDLDTWVTTNLAPIYHAVGTCRMGKPGDTQSVVDSSCRLIGFENVSVIDASVFPTLPVANPALTVAMVAMQAGHRLATTLSERWTT